MSMTIGEANAVQRVLDHVVAAPTRPPVELVGELAFLADRSYAVLHAGSDAHDVHNAWPEPEPDVEPEREVQPERGPC